MNAAVQPMPAPYSPTPSQIAMAYSVCRSITRSAAKNFYYSFLVLPPAKRQALCAVYAFMRRCDDISDDGKFLPFERRQMLEAWVDSFHRAQAGHPTDDAVLLALTDTQRRFNIPAELLDQLAFGTGMDIQQDSAANSTRTEGLQVLYRTFGDLRVYCYRVASVVGLVCIRIFGYRDPAAEPLAESLGLAFQLTNIIRDIKEDAALGRIYLPAEDLARFKIEPAEEDSQPALWVLVTIYRRLLEKITQRQYDVFTEKIILSVREKVVILGKGLLKRLA